ncbi:nardilysin-like [Paramuricea clavata]|uniref:Nardilysin-like n=1 Tax=Paramuricea clavata TaxID=317549 RepID=A0A6S7INR6_PARCT|nr:nardilysin-like [Paramuricea clavata]
MIHECTSGKVWHKQDDTFFIPKAIFNIYFKSPLINRNAKNMVLAEIFALLLDFDLKDVAYAADVAELSYCITVCQTGIIMNFCGFSDKLQMLFQKVIEHMNTFEVKETQFNMVKEQATRAYYNRIIKPEKLVR